MSKKEYKVTTTTKIEPIRPSNVFNSVISRFEQPMYEELTFTQECYLKLLFYINLVGDNEVSGYGKIVNDKIVDLYLPKQVLTGATAIIDENAMVDMLREVPSEDLQYYTLDWHSHNNMGASPSSTDKENYKLQAEQRGNKQFVAMIINKSEKIWCKNVICGEKYSDVEVGYEGLTLSRDEMKKIYDSCVEEVKNKCTSKVTVTTRQSNYVSVPKGSKKITTHTPMEALDDKREIKCCSCGKVLTNYFERKDGICWDCKTVYCNDLTEYDNEYYYQPSFWQNV